jgi:membrane-associated phospholipid phosphatase
MNGFLDCGVGLLLWLQGLGAWLTPPMTFFTFLGQAEFYLFVMPALLWCFDAGLGLTIGVLLMSSVGVNSILKLAFGLPRPAWVRKDVLALGTETTFGLPSGHAQNGVVVWGRLAAASQRRLAVLGCAVLILLISVSRIYLGVHFPMDILAGWVFGGIILWLALRLAPAVRRLGASLSLPLLLGGIFLISIAMVGIGAAIAARRGPVPPAWVENAARGAPGPSIDPLSTDDLLISGGVLFGMGAGGILLFRGAGFSAGGPVPARLLRYAIGLVGVVLIYYGLRLVFPPGYAALHYLRYATVGFWVTFLAPKLFIRLGLASPSQRRAA